MAMIRCKADLHFYDVDKYDSCPYCLQLNGENKLDQPLPESDFGETIVAVAPRPRPAKAKEPLAEQPVEGPASVKLPPSGHSVSENASASPLSVEPVENIPVAPREDHPSNPVVGWLVCTDGYERGRDYRIRAGTNEIGSETGEEVDIVITGDKSISGRYHAEIQYDHEENVFYLIKMKNQAVKVNDAVVMRPVRLNSYDVVQFGETRLVFVPLCSEKFQWNDLN